MHIQYRQKDKCTQNVTATRCILTEFFFLLSSWDAENSFIGHKAILIVCSERNLAWILQWMYMNEHQIKYSGSRKTIYWLLVEFIMYVKIVICLCLKEVNSNKKKIRYVNDVSMAYNCNIRSMVLYGVFQHISLNTNEHWSACLKTL